jgi:4,5-DOPA dioxygenase extradiol
MSTPLLFISHGSPMTAVEDDGWTDALRSFGRSLSGVRAVAVVSAHWQEPSPVRFTAQERPPLVHDFSGFPPELYGLTYAAPGAPDLARALAAAVKGAGHPVVLEEERGWDHGVWIPLRRMLPEAGTPVVQVSLPSDLGPAGLAGIGAALAPFRSRGVLLVGSGGVVHNLRRIHPEKDAPVDPWAREFDDWVRERAGRGDLAGLARYRAEAPRPDLAVPTTEHFDPLFVVLGAAAAGETLSDVHEGFAHGNLSMRTFSIS